MLEPALTVQKAGLGMRFLARVIDSMLAWWVGLAGNLLGVRIMERLTEAGMASPGWETTVISARVVRSMVWLLAWFFCPFVSEAVSGSTLGKSICRIRVVSENLRRASVLQCLLRALGFFVDICLLCAVGVVTILKSRKKQRFGDMWARTIVVPLRAAPVPAWMLAAGVAAGFATGIVFVLMQWAALFATFAR